MQYSALFLGYLRLVSVIERTPCSSLTTEVSIFFEANLFSVKSRHSSKLLFRSQTPLSGAVMFLSPLWYVMSYWEKNWRKNLKLITVDETPNAQQIQVSRWLQVRCEYLLGASGELEAECLIQEFDDCSYQDTCC